jgi:hypothetical protein
MYGENYEKFEELKKYFNENPEAKVQPVERNERVAAKTQEPWERKW